MLLFCAYIWPVSVIDIRWYINHIYDSLHHSMTAVKIGVYPSVYKKLAPFTYNWPRP